MSKAENFPVLAPERTRLARLERAVETLAWWLVDAQTGFAARDARAISEILCGARDPEDGYALGTSPNVASFSRTAAEGEER